MDQQKESEARAHLIREGLLPTYDPDVFIEEEYPGYVRYRNILGRRWEVLGKCDYRGDCLVGSVGAPTGPRESRMDVPVSPEFKGCCPFVIKELACADNLLPA